MTFSIFKNKAAQAGQTHWQVMAILVAIVAASAWLYDFGKLHGVDELAETRHAKNELQSKFNALDEERKELQQQLAIHSRSDQIDQHAKIGVRGEVAALQDEILELRKELALYRGIFSPKDVRPGLRVQKFQLQAADLPGRFHFDLTLTQVIKNDRRTRGVVRIEVLGDEDGNTVLLVFKNAGENDKPLKFGFRYFQHLRGEIRLPVTFHPRIARIKVVTEGRNKAASIEKDIDWPDLKPSQEKG